MSGKPIIRDLAGMMEWKGSFGPSSVEIAHGHLAVDVLASTTAEELLPVLEALVGPDAAKLIVGPLLDHGLLFDSTLESELG